MDTDALLAPVFLVCRFPVEKVPGPGGMLVERYTFLRVSFLLLPWLPAIWSNSQELSSLCGESKLVFCSHSSKFKCVQPL